MRRRLPQYFLALTVLSLCACTVRAQQVSSAALQQCAQIRIAARRLRCYDSLAAKPSPARSASVHGRGMWMVTDTTDPLNDSREVILYLDATSGRSVYGQPVNLVLRCRDGDTEVYVNWNSYISEDDGVVTMRVGTDSAEVDTWSVSTNNEATFYHGDPAQLIQRLIKANRLVVQTTPYQENPITAIFDLQGLASSVKPLRDACGW